jgi:hypothetical protein
MSALVKVALGLFVAAQVAIVAAVGWEALWLAALGLAAAVVVGVGARLVRAPLARVAACLAIVTGCVVLTFEGGLFFVPAALVLLVAAIREHRMKRGAPA